MLRLYDHGIIFFIIVSFFNISLNNYFSFLTYSLRLEGWVYQQFSSFFFKILSGLRDFLLINLSNFFFQSSIGLRDFLLKHNNFYQSLIFIFIFSIRFRDFLSIYLLIFFRQLLLGFEDFLSISKIRFFQLSQLI